jgi:hypothetical protein
MLKAALTCAVLTTMAASAGAQIRRPPPPRPDDRPKISMRPFFLVAGQQPLAKATFEAAFDTTGERVFVNNGEVFRLGIPLTTTISPLEFTGGYRFNTRRAKRLIPYAGGGVGWYGYKEVSSFAAQGEDVDTRHVGALATAGAEIRLHRWIGVGLDVAFTHVPGVLGVAGASKELGEDNLGGVAARARVIFGR